MAFLRLIRAKNLLIIALLQCLLRYLLVLPILDFYGLEPVMSNARFILLLVATLSLAASGYVINNYFDVKTDIINRPGKVVVGKVFSRRVVLLWHVVFTILGMFSGLLLAYFTRKENYALMFILIPGLLWYYSTTFKKQILIGNLVIAFLTALVPYFVVSLEFASMARVYGAEVLSSEACSAAWSWVSGFAFFAFVTTLGREIIKDIEDVKGDREAGCKTLPIEMGESYTKTVVLAINITTVVALGVVWFVVPELRNSTLTLGYFVVLLAIPYAILSYTLLKASKPQDYHRASQISKLIMLAGILYVFVAQTFF
jgi:4-hydroxybenzoate polyprenyltransferase